MSSATILARIASYQASAAQEHLLAAKYLAEGHARGAILAQRAAAGHHEIAALWMAVILEHEE